MTNIKNHIPLVHGPKGTNVDMSYSNMACYFCFVNKTILYIAQLFLVHANENNSLQNTINKNQS